MTRQRLLSVGLIVLAIAAIGANLSFMLTVLSLRMEHLGYNATLIGLSHAVHYLAVLLVAPVLPGIIARFGLVWAYGGAAALLVCATLAYSVSEAHYPLILILRVCMGIAIASFFMIGESWINGMIPDEWRGRVVAVYCGVLTIGFTVGSALLQWVPTLGMPPFILSACLVTATLIPVWMGRKHQPLTDNHSEGGIFTIMRQAPLIAIIGFVFGLAETTLLSMLSLYGLREGMDESSAALMLTVLLAGGVCWMLPTGMLLDRMNKRLVMALNFGLSGAMAVALPFTLGTPWLMWAVLFIWGAGLLTAYPVVMALIGGEFAGKTLVQATVLLITMYGLGSALGPFCGGVAMDEFGSQGLPWVVAVSCLLCMVVALVSWRQHLPKTSH